jgi:hypothetical protein
MKTGLQPSRHAGGGRQNSIIADGLELDSLTRTPAHSAAIPVFLVFDAICDESSILFRSKRD